MIDRRRQQDIQNRFCAIRIRKLNDAALDLVAIVHQKDFAAGQLCAAHNNGISGRADEAQVRLSLYVDGAAGQVEIA